MIAFLSVSNPYINMTPQTLEIIRFTFMGLLGGFSYVLLNSDGWDSLTSFTSIRHLMVSLIVGFLYYHLYSEWNFPNQVMSFVSAYMGPSFVQSLVKRLSGTSETTIH